VISKYVAKSADTVTIIDKKKSGYFHRPEYVNFVISPVNGMLKIYITFTDNPVFLGDFPHFAAIGQAGY
jgi:hypothetical protein